MMTLAEFKAWLDGYTDGKNGLSPDQLAAVVAKLALVREPFAIVTPGPLLPGTQFPEWLQPVFGHTSAGMPQWMNGATLTNVAALGPEFERALFRDIEELYQN